MSGFIKREAERAAKQVGTTAPFEDLNLGTLGQVSIGPDGRPVVGQDPRIAAQQQQLLSLAGRGGGFAAGLQEGTAGFAQDALSAGRGLLADTAGFDPLNAAEERFSRLQSVLDPQRNRQREQLESRLLSQGRLDSTTGNVLGGELERGFSATDANLLNQLFLEGEQAQSNARAQAIGLGQSGAQLGGGLFGQLQAGGQSAQALDQGLLQSLGASQAVGGAFGNQDIARANAINAFNASGVAGRDGGGTLGAIGTLGGAALGAYFGRSPEAVAAGAQAGGSLGNLFT